MNRPSVSVIIPAYRAETTICRAVDSVLCQTAPAAEVLVIDDGSPDDLVSALRPYNDRVTLIRKSNSGAASARNAGINRATGEFIAFLDADDYWLPRKLERQLDVFVAHREVGLVAGQFYWQPPATVARAALNIDWSFDSVLKPHREAAFRVAMRISTVTVMVRRSALAEMRFDESLTTAEDRDLWVRLVSSAPVYLLSEPLATAVVQAGSLSHSNVENDCSNMLRVVHRYRQLLGHSGLRKWEANTYRRWAAGHLGNDCPQAAVRPACKRLARQPWSPEAWWIVGKSLGWSLFEQRTAAKRHAA